MPKAWRQCSICDTNSFKMSHLVIFKTPAKCGHGYRDVCELHFQPEDMRTHGDSKRYAFIIRPKTVQFGVGQSWLRKQMTDYPEPLMTYSNITFSFYLDWIVVLLRHCCWIKSQSLFMKRFQTCTQSLRMKLTIFLIVLKRCSKTWK